MSDVEALCPYVYQILAQLLDCSSSGLLSPAYANLFPVLLSPALWERPSTVAAIVKLLETYLRKFPQALVPHLPGILGVFQKLISQRATETHAFSLLRPIFCFLPLSSYQTYLSEIIKILMLRLQSRLQGRNAVVYTKDLILTCSVFVGKHGAHPLVSAVEAVQSG
jgi:exportin-2 (importin alpha re-exporter)